MEDENSKKWNCIYLPYLDSRKKISEGRKVALKYCVPDVRTSEISTALKQLKFEHKVEKKSYCRDFLSVGRIRVELKRDGDLIDETIKNRRQLLIEIGKLLPNLEIYKKRLEMEKNKSTKKTKGKKKRKK